MDQLKEGEKIQALVVALPNLTDVTHVTVTYHKYKGWIYNGKSDWNIDFVEVMDSAGNV